MATVNPARAEVHPVEGVYSEMLVAQGGQRNKLIQVAGMPAGLQFDPETGRIHGTPERCGAYEVRVSADGSRIEFVESLWLEFAGWVLGRMDRDATRRRKP